MHIITTHQNADFDAIASMLGVHKLNPDTVPLLPRRLNRNVRQFLALYRSGLPFVSSAHLPDQPITRITLTDTQSRPELSRAAANIPVCILDHHRQERELRPNETWKGEQLGAVTTLIVEQIQREQVSIEALEATLLAMGIYEDTGMLTYGSTTPRDIRAAAWLMEKGAALDTLRRFLSHPLNDEQQWLMEQLLRNTDTRDIEGHVITVCTTSTDRHIEGINSVAGRLRDILDLSALFVLVDMPRSAQLVCRGTNDVIDVGAVARLFGGGGHARAAAATIYNRPAAEVAAGIWDYVIQHVKPAVRVSDLMSYGVQTVRADTALTEVLPRIRRIGHEGYPVLQNGQVVGLLTRRDADRAAEHGLDLTIRDVMMEGQVTLQAHDSVATLEQLMVNSGWGQIPVYEADTLVGIVTRTDLIKHWARTHPEIRPEPNLLDVSQLEGVVGQAGSQIIDLVATMAQEKRVALYLVGGVVRDLMLNRPNFDLDFVVEGDAIHFAEALRQQFGGQIHSYRPFGTAKWLLESVEIDRIDRQALPSHIDFASARNEFYEHPTALPTVYSGSIKLDLQRRDFTINTLAVQLSPADHLWRILDFYGGLNDMEQKHIRVLHSLSFVDDPTRILRAVRFATRLSFSIEPRTAELISTALPMLRRITGERIRNELSLLMREAHPAHGLIQLQQMGALTAIHPQFTITDNIRRDMYHYQRQQIPWAEQALAPTDACWHIIMSRLPVSAARSICKRLLFNQEMSRSLIDSADLMQPDNALHDEHATNSQIARLLDQRSAVAQQVVWALTGDEQVQKRIERYQSQWRHIQPYHDGHDLKAIGLEPGPAYSHILSELKRAWIDERVKSQDEEHALLQRLIAEFNGGTYV